MYPFAKASNEIGMVADRIGLYGGILLIVMGFFGNCLNILVFAKLKLFRKNPSAFCILIESMVNIGQVFIAFMGYLLFFTFNISASTNSVAWCKLRNVAQQICNLIFMGIICLAAFDQYLSTNPRGALRQCSSLPLMRHSTIVLILLALLHSIPFIIFFDIYPNQGCVVRNNILSLYHSNVYYPILIGLLPILITVVFTSIAFYHARHLVRRNIPTMRRRLDRQFTAMFFVRVLSFILLTLPYVIERIVLLNISYKDVSIFSSPVACIVSAIIALLFSSNYVISFYLFCASSTRFRRQVKCVAGKVCWQMISCVMMGRMPRRGRNQIAPSLQTLPSGSPRDSI